MTDRDYPAPWPDTVCNVAGCTQRSETLDLFAGRRCRTHRPRYSPRIPETLTALGWEHAAAAYRRTFLAGRR